MDTSLAGSNMINVCKAFKVKHWDPHPTGGLNGTHTHLDFRPRVQPQLIICGGITLVIST